MNATEARSPEKRPCCRQPGCLLRQDALDRERLAGLLVQLLAGVTPGTIARGHGCIKPGPFCARCALGVIEGQRACATEPEWKRLDTLGHWHDLRRRRRERWWH